MPDEEGVPVKMTVNDKRRNSETAGEPTATSRSSEHNTAEPRRTSAEAGSAAQPSPPDEGRDYLDDLKRLQAEFDNYRKRMMKEQAQVAARATSRLVERLLPVLDNFEQAIAHGEGGSGVELVYKQLKQALVQEGLEEIPAEGVPFDPTVHEAVESLEEPDIEEPMCRTVYRRGYRLKGQLLRPAMVVVARAPEGASVASDEEDVGEDVERLTE